MRLTQVRHAGPPGWNLTSAGMPNDESPLRVAQPERQTVPRDWVQKWEARQRELYALFAGCALSPEFVEGIVARALHQETAAYLAAYRVELPMWRRSLRI